jgi:site-specific recombinase XerD
MKDKSYRAFPLGIEAGHYLRAKHKRLTAESYRDNDSCLDKLARHFADLGLSDLEPPVGTERLEGFLDFQWRTRAARTYNKNLSILRDFFTFQVVRRRLHGDPTLPIERAKARATCRTTFTCTDRVALVSANQDLSRPALYPAAARLRTPQGRGARHLLQAFRPSTPAADDLHQGGDDP